MTCSIDVTLSEAKGLSSVPAWPGWENLKMTEMLIGHIEWAASNAAVWGFVLIFVLMAIESSVIPLPSEVVLIPAGFLVHRHALTFGDPVMDFIAAVLCGMFGSLAGAYANYFVSLFVGRPFILRYGKYFFVKPHVFTRAEEIFLEYGDISTFAGRLLPVIRHLISIPAGISRMPLLKFSFYTVIGAGIWSSILLWIGYYLGTLSANMTYAQLVHKGEALLKENYVWMFLGLAGVVGVYVLVHRLVMKQKGDKA
jgi:membrane protein DedA with SNARE-associated domain